MIETAVALKVYNILKDEKDLMQKTVCIEENEQEPEFIRPRITNYNNQMYSSILFIMDKLEGLKSEELPSVVSLGSSGYLTFYFSSTALCSYIKEMERIGIMRQKECGYFFVKEREGSAGKYIWFPANERKFRVAMKELGVRSRQECEFRDDGVSSKEVKNLSFYFGEQLRFTSCCNKRRPYGMNGFKLTKLIQASLLKEYPQYKFYKGVVKDINGYYTSNPERVISYDPLFKYNSVSKTIHKIYIRIISGFGRYPRNHLNGFADKESYIKQNDFNLKMDTADDWFGVANLIKTGKWVDGRDVTFGNVLQNTCLEMSEELLPVIKFYLYRSYFGWRPEYLISSLEYKLRDLGMSLTDAEKEELAVFLGEINKVADRFFTERGGVEITFHLSNIYLSMLKKLLKDGFDCVFSYGAFYARKDGVRQEDFVVLMRKLIKQVAEAYYARWCAR